MAIVTGTARLNLKGCQRRTNAHTHGRTDPRTHGRIQPHARTQTLSQSVSKPADKVNHENQSMRNPGHNRKKAAAAQRMRSLGVQEAFFLVCTAAKLHIHTPTTDCPGACSDFPPFRPPPFSNRAPAHTNQAQRQAHTHAHGPALGKAAQLSRARQWRARCVHSALGRAERA